MEGFERLPWTPNSYAQTGRVVWSAAPTSGPMGLAPASTPSFPLERLIDLTSPDAVIQAGDQGAVLQSDWSPGLRGVKWGSSARASFSLKLEGIENDVTLALGIADAALDRVFRVWVNMAAPIAVTTKGSRLRVTVPRDALTASNFLHVWLEVEDGEPIVLSSVQVTRQSELPIYKPGRLLSFAEGGQGQDYLAQGWGTPENWGVWSLAVRADVILRLGQELARGASVTADVVAFVPRGQVDQIVSMTIGDVRLGEWPLSTDSPQQTLRAQIPAQFYGSDLVVGFEVSRFSVAP